MAKVKDQHVLGILQLPGTLCELVVAQVLGKQEHKAAVTLCPTPKPEPWGGSPGAQKELESIHGISL